MYDLPSMMMLLLCIFREVHLLRNHLLFCCFLSKCSSTEPSLASCPTSYHSQSLSQSVSYTGKSHGCNSHNTVDGSKRSSSPFAGIPQVLLNNFSKRHVNKINFAFFPHFLLCLLIYYSWMVISFIYIYTCSGIIVYLIGLMLNDVQICIALKSLQLKKLFLKNICKGLWGNL